MVSCTSSTYIVPPLVALASVAAQIVGLITVRKAFNWSRALPYLVGGVIGVPLGIAALAGGFLGGFAALSGPLPLLWLQLRGGDSAEQSATYQPFNLIVLALASIGMGISGQITRNVLWMTLFCLPMTIIGAWVGARTYAVVSPQTFQRVVLSLLLVSGCILIAQALKL